TPPPAGATAPACLIARGQNAGTLDVTREVRCARMLGLFGSNNGIGIRAGLHTGEVGTVGDKVGAIAVSIGARIGAMAEPSEVLVSQTVRTSSQVPHAPSKIAASTAHSSASRSAASLKGPAVRKCRASRKHQHGKRGAQC